METKILIIAIVAWLLVVAWHVRLRYRQRRVEKDSGVRPDSVDSASIPEFTFVKCHVKTFSYEDGHIEERHSYCDGLGLEGLTDAAAQMFHPDSPLRHVGNQVHSIRVDR